MTHKYCCLCEVCPDFLQHCLAGLEYYDLLARIMRLVSINATSQPVTLSMTLCTMTIKAYATADSCCLMSSTRHDVHLLLKFERNADTTYLVTQYAVSLVTPVVHHPLETELLPTSQQLHEYQSRSSRCCKLPALGFHLFQVTSKA